MESKHRFRNSAPVITPTNDPVPSTFWDIKNKNGMEAAKKWAATSYDGKNVGVKKIDGDWKFVIIEGGSDEKVENQNPADTFNTVLKIAKKRAFVDATITATASSDFFTQDLEDIRDNLAAVETKTVQSNGGAATTSGTAAREPKGSTQQADNAQGSTSNWGDVICTYGKKNGPLRGKKLGELSDDSLEFLCKTLLVDGREHKPADRKMVAALGIWKEESKGKAAAPKSDGEIPDFNGPNHEKLFEQLRWDNVKIDDFMAAMKKAKLIPENAASFAAMSDETARKFIDDWENAQLLVKQHLETK